MSEFILSVSVTGGLQMFIPPLCLLLCVGVTVHLYVTRLTTIHKAKGGSRPHSQFTLLCGFRSSCTIRVACTSICFQCIVERTATSLGDPFLSSGLEVGESGGFSDVSRGLGLTSRVHVRTLIYFYFSRFYTLLRS